MSYALTSVGDGLVLEWKHQHGDDPDTFVSANAAVFESAAMLDVHVWDFDGDSVLLGLVAELRSRGKLVTLHGETPRANEVISLLG